MVLLEYKADVFLAEFSALLRRQFMYRLIEENDKSDLHVSNCRWNVESVLGS